jgi:hypothetical protein
MFHSYGLRVLTVAAVCVAWDTLAVQAQGVDAMKEGSEFRLGGQMENVGLPKRGENPGVE